MKRLLFILVLLLVISIGLAVDYEAYRENDKFGYKNEAGEWVIAPQFTSALDFKNGVALVAIDRKYGLIDEQGGYIVPCEWDDINFAYYKDSGIVGVTKAGLKGALRPGEGLVTPCMWEDVDLYDYRWGAMAVKKDGKYGAIDKNGRMIMAYEFDEVDLNQWYHFIVTKAGKKGLCNIEGKQIVPCGYDSVWYYPDEKGMVRVEQNGKKGLCDANGKEVIPCKYDMIYYDDHCEAYSVNIENSGKTTYGLYLADGTELFPCIYDYTGKDSTGYYAGLNGKRIELDVNGKPKDESNLKVPDPMVPESSVVVQDEKGGDITGTWSYSIDFNKQSLKLEGGKIENLSKISSTGKMQLRYYLTTTKYQSGTLNGYVLAQIDLDSIKPGWEYNINQNLSFICTPPDGMYYQTLCLLEDKGSGFYIQDFLNFDKQVSFTSVNKWNAVADALQNFSNSLNSINGYTPPISPGYNSTPQSTGKKVQVTCSSCNGTGWNPGKEYPPSFGLGIQYRDYPCETCGSYEVHYHKRCMVCSGKGYTEKWQW